MELRQLRCLVAVAEELRFARAAAYRAIAPVTRDESVKLTFACPASLKADLDSYAALHAQAYGEAVDAEKLIPHMLEAFIAGDRGFRKGATPRAVPPKQP